MSDPRQPSSERLTALSRVRCLECGSAYAKPAKGGTVEQNPGCPRCGYIGWIPASVEFTPQPPEGQSRSVEDLLRHRIDRRR